MLLSRRFLVHVTCCRIGICGDLEVEALRAAWQRVVDAYPALRTAFSWTDAADPVQVIHRPVALRWEVADYRSVAREERSEMLDRLEFRCNWNLTMAPLMNVALVRLEDRDWMMLWRSSDLILDAPSRTRVLERVFREYTRRTADSGNRPSTRPASSRVTHSSRAPRSHQDDRAAARAYWARLLQNATVGRLIPRMTTPGAPQDLTWGHCAVTSVGLSERERVALVEFARRNRVHPRTLLYAAWARVLAAATQTTDVLFGIRVSTGPGGRIKDPHAVGAFSVTLPLRLAGEPDADTGAWLRSMERQERRAKRSRDVPRSELAAFVGLGHGETLYESVVDASASDTVGRLRSRWRTLDAVQLLEDAVYPPYPLTIRWQRQPTLRYTITYDRRIFAPPLVQHLA